MRKTEEKFLDDISSKAKDTPDAPTKFTNPDGTLKNGPETIDILKDW